jgi:predicted SnoaL-like aldol condensation-catalyzing enzyme/predicted enzyme related to lactoylglutathione lyase
MKIKLNSVLVDDQDKALTFYTEVLGFVKKSDFPAGEFRWLTVASPEDPGGTELLLEPNNNPAAKSFQKALFEQGIPLTSFAVQDIQKEYERLARLGVAFTMKPTKTGPATIGIFDDTCGNLIQLGELSSLEQVSEKAGKISRKEAAVSYLRLASSGKVREAYDAYVGPNFRHHNPYFKGDAQALMAAMEENATMFPDKVLEVQHALEDGDFVAVHSRSQLKPGDLGVATVHIFRFDGDHIVELWDVGQAVPEDSPNENGMF